MSRFARALAFLLCCAPFTLLAEDAPSEANTPAGNELKVLQEMLEQQSKQIDVLAQEIAHLNLLLESKNSGGAPPPAAALAVTSSEPESAPPAQTAPGTIPKALPANAPAAAAPAATPAPTGPVHIVTKGETLTAIAKHYKVSVPELLKVNKIVDARKLQIGQTLVLPPGAKIPVSPSPSP